LNAWWASYVGPPPPMEVTEGPRSSALRDDSGESVRATAGRCSVRVAHLPGVKHAPMQMTLTSGFEPRPVAALVYSMPVTAAMVRGATITPQARISWQEELTRASAVACCRWVAAQISRL
jgi:hypothetical protein